MIHKSIDSSYFSKGFHKDDIAVTIPSYTTSNFAGMKLLTGKSKKTVLAIIHNNVLALPDGKVIAVLLGHCVFGWDGQVKAKLFRHTLFDLKGQVIAREDENMAPPAIDTEKILKAGWELITKIKDHSCPIIDPLDKWSATPIAKHFLTNESMAVL